MAIAPVRLWRGLLVWLHVICAVTWMGQALTLMTLLGLSAASGPGEFKAATAAVAELLDHEILGSAAIAAAFTGFGLSAVTTWGFFHHRWVSIKIVLTTLQILTGTLVVGGSLPAIVASARAGSDGPIVVSAVAVGLVAVASAFQVWLSVVKPMGRTARGRRLQAQGTNGQLPTAPAWLIATMFIAAAAEIPLGMAWGIPLPYFSLPVLVVALVVRRRHDRRSAAAVGGEPAKSATTAATRVVSSVVVDRTDLTTGVVSLRLAPADGSPVATWTPGAHVDLHLPSGRVRQYSLHGDPADRLGYDISVLLEATGRGASSEIHALEAGAQVGIGGPRNNFPVDPAPSYLFIAGGIGVTALKPMLEHVQTLGKPWQLVYRGRTRAEMVFADQLEASYPDKVRILPADITPRPDLSMLLKSLPTGTAVYCCGPETLMDAVALAVATHCPQGTLHVERFTATTKDDSRNRPFQIVLPQAGTIVDVSADQGMLEALRPVLPETPASCETGICGSCEMRVLGGRPEHRDDILTGAERERTDIVYPCVSRSRSTLLVLDA